jgi:hypothetical protein
MTTGERASIYQIYYRFLFFSPLNSSLSLVFIELKKKKKKKKKIKHVVNL